MILIIEKSTHRNGKIEAIVKNLVRETARSLINRPDRHE